MNMKIIWALITISFLSSCASFNAPLYNSSFKHTNSLRQGNYKSLYIDDVRPPKNQKIEKLTVRAVGEIVPPQGSYSLYLKDALTQELSEARLIETKDKTDTVIQLQLVENKMSTMGEGTLITKATFKIIQDSVIVYDKTHTGMSEWDPKFTGGEAYSQALQRVSLAYQNLVNKLLNDKDFLSVIEEAK